MMLYRRMPAVILALPLVVPGCARDNSLNAVANEDGQRCSMASASDPYGAVWKASTPLGDDGRYHSPATFIELNENWTLSGDVSIRIDRDRMTPRGPITEYEDWIEDLIDDFWSADFNEITINVQGETLYRDSRFGMDFGSQGVAFGAIADQSIPIVIENQGRAYNCDSLAVPGSEWTAAHNGYVDELDIDPLAPFGDSGSYVTLNFEGCPISRIDLRVAASNPSDWGRPDPANLSGCGPGSMHAYNFWPRISAEVDHSEDFTVSVGTMINGSLPEREAGFRNQELATIVDYLDFGDGLPVGIYIENLNRTGDWDFHELVALCLLDFSAGDYESPEHRLIDSRDAPFSVDSCLYVEPGCTNPSRIAECITTNEPFDGVTASVWFEARIKNYNPFAGRFDSVEPE